MTKKSTTTDETAEIAELLAEWGHLNRGEWLQKAKELREEGRRDLEHADELLRFVAEEAFRAWREAQAAGEEGDR